MGQSKPYTTGRPLNDSLFSMWRCVIAVAHADGIMHETEIAHFRQLFKDLDRSFKLTPAQRGQLEDDLKTAPPVESLLAKITDDEQRLLLVNFAHVVAHVDGELHPNEAALLAVLDRAVPVTQETLRIRDEIRRDIAQQMAQRAADAVSGDARGCALTYALNALLHRLGITTP
jgi:uncharacterized tellurite resistance protein B-like protein